MTNEKDEAKKPIKHLQLRVSPQLHRRLRLAAAHEGVSSQSIVINALVAELVRLETKIKKEVD